MSKYHNDASHASDPVQIRLSLAHLRHFYPRDKISPLNPRGYRNLQQFEDVINEHLSFGDSRAAVVYSLQPFVVASYSDELDCSVLLEFPDEVRQHFHTLQPGDRLLTVNTYFQGSGPVRDVWNGPASLFQYANYYPVIADFFSADTVPITARKNQIEEKEWQRCLDGAAEYARRNPGRTRRGDPLYSLSPA